MLLGFLIFNNGVLNSSANGKPSLNVVYSSSWYMIKPSISLDLKKVDNTLEKTFDFIYYKYDKTILNVPSNPNKTQPQQLDSYQ